MSKEYGIKQLKPKAFRRIEFKNLVCLMWI
jgi:hypothetical protein